ncbi:poly(A)-binding protein binding protein [Ophidiomyces ophidiicola]|uniref:Poly(A)-binding protein binding protein n=1 Tax=Ophidiomyces ophidiicola TaxID=1387563 RepID=A0ACB8V1R6_9EURO|nr:poly(A)-binding protein binding protein [Ophidiomyces ophidiicola]KAI1922181.1 poly(A)-binding protein binding protein [Ophidiomyces ophidiicola]KAI1953754.1 poly(A)-binding protein binding protein [Ophidiomyces ophidiicola]KAI1954836.1 poly(A)-binding protein binding protein [Ophidiomyces ophidiicola]KAI1967271.1 poly(A)-binding protein binding protein [Ophidiomyces ophidiicola]KAI1975051.1 poly(A)-binding protein binding protein [Ophidiomyces ophidiicola]
MTCDHRRNNTPRAWMQNTNPVARKDGGPNSQQNGASRKFNMSPKPSASKESSTPDMHAHDRLIFLMTAFIGANTIITTKSGEKYSGIFSGSVLESNETSFVLKMTRLFSLEQDSVQPNGTSNHTSPYVGPGPDHKMVFDAQDVADVAVEGVSTSGMVPKEQNAFRTDTDISGNQPGRERELQRWEPGTDAVVEMSLEASGSAGTWDQFETNARLFGATSSYDENLYTTRIDRSDPSYKRKEAEAARIAREIESTDTDNIHIREERNLIHPQDDMGEEDKYSGVRRGDFPPLQTGGPNKYTPPARRPPMGHPTVPGAPVDPAIISAQVAQPRLAPTKSASHTYREAEQKLPDKPTDVVTSKDTSPDANKPTDLPKPASTSELPDTEGKHTAVKPMPNLTIPPKRTNMENAATNVETEVLDQFRQFANSEKLKLQERRRNQAQYDRTIKLNELVKFSKNFKLGTPVPKDLVPILAKDPNKQEEIVQKARKQHEEKLASEAAARAAAVASASATAVTATTTTSSTLTEQKQATRQTGPTGNSRYDVAPTSATQTLDRPMYPRGRQGYPPVGPQSGRPASHLPSHPGRAGSGMLSHRLADIQQQRKGAAMGNVPAALPINESRAPPSGPTNNGDQVNVQKSAPPPSSAVSTKFNAQALEFKPNPTAHTFTPATTSAVSSSPASNVRTGSISRAASPSAFFGSKKLTPAAERPSLDDHFNPVKRAKKDATEQSVKDFAFNGGIPPAYKTPPTWEVTSINQEKTYVDMFKASTSAPSASPQTRSASNPQIQPHQNPMPFHLQQGNQNTAPNNGPPHGPHHHLLPPQHHQGGQPHYEDHRMQPSASASHAYPSPRLQHSHMPYQSPMAPHAQLVIGQGMPQFYVGQGPQPPHMRHYPGAPQFVNPQNGMGAPMMVHQPSNGPYMGIPQGMGAPYNPQMQMYSPSPAHAYPQHVQPPPQPHSGYPSPSRGAPMMIHQGSQQGQPPQPVMSMNPGQHGQPFYPPQQPGHIPGGRPGHPQQHPHFASSPNQTHHYPHHQYRAPSSNHSYMPHIPPPHMHSQGPPQGPTSNVHNSEANEEVK